MDYAQQLKRIEAKKSKDRRSAKLIQNKDTVMDHGPQRKGSTRDIVGEASGFGSGRTYARAKYLYENAVETTNQRLNVMLNAKDLIDDLQERAKENRGKRNDLTSGSTEPNVKKSMKENEEIARLAGVSKSTVVRAKN